MIVYEDKRVRITNFFISFTMRLPVFRAGDRVTVVRGSYKGNRGVIIRPCLVKAWVILDSDGCKHPLAKTSLRLERNSTPETYLNGIFELYPEIDEEVEQLCNSLARCAVHPRSRELQDHIANRIEHHADLIRQGYGSLNTIPSDLERLNTMFVPSGRVLVVEEP